jgi:hypothetical protein
VGAYINKSSFKLVSSTRYLDLSPDGTGVLELSGIGTPDELEIGAYKTFSVILTDALFGVSKVKLFYNLYAGIDFDVIMEDLDGNQTTPVTITATTNFSTFYSDIEVANTEITNVKKVIIQFSDGNNHTLYLGRVELSYNGWNTLDGFPERVVYGLNKGAFVVKKLELNGKQKAIENDILDLRNKINVLDDNVTRKVLFNGV